MARIKNFDEQEVLDRAVMLFWQQGYHATSMQDLVDHLGISRSSLYDTFGDKRALFLASLQRYRARFGQAMVDALEQANDLKPTLEAIFQAAVQEMITDPKHKGCMIVNSATETATHDPEVARIVKENMEVAEDAFYKAIKRAQASGELSPEKDAQALARFLFNTLSGLKVSSKFTSSPARYEDVVAVALSVLD